MNIVLSQLLHYTLIFLPAQQAIAQSAKATSEAQATQAAIAAAQHQAAQQTLTKAAADAASAATTAMGLMGSLGKRTFSQSCYSLYLYVNC